jgi:superfamily II DNA/RNA helicase
MIATSLLFEGEEVRYIDFDRLIEIGRTQKQNDFDFSHVKYLVVDDFNRSTQFAFTDYVIPLLTSRMNNGKCTIVTSTLHPNSFKSSNNNALERFGAKMIANYGIAEFLIKDNLRSHYGA